MGALKVTCPLCKLENPQGATRCDCGYMFAAAAGTLPQGSVHHLESIDRSLRVIKYVIVAWAVLTVIGWIILAAQSSR